MCDVCSVTDAERQSHRTEIALIGDTMNTAARIQQACRETDNRVLASRPSSTFSRRSRRCRCPDRLRLRLTSPSIEQSIFLATNGVES